MTFILVPSCKINFDTDHLSDAECSHEPTKFTKIMMNVDPRKQVCSNCCQRRRCLPSGLEGSDLEQLESLISQHRQIRRGEHVFRIGETFQNLIAIRSGFFKTYRLLEGGDEHISGFHMAGDIIGMDAISAAHNTCHAVALEDSDICEIPFLQLEDLCRDLPALQHQLYELMSHAIMRGRDVLMLLGDTNAEERLASFLLNLSQRYAARGYSAIDFHLRMKRDEIGRYLGMEIETVSRTLKKLQKHRLIAVHKRHIVLQDLVRLHQVANREIEFSKNTMTPDIGEIHIHSRLQC